MKVNTPQQPQNTQGYGPQQYGSPADYGMGYGPQNQGYGYGQQQGYQPQQFQQQGYQPQQFQPQVQSKFSQEYQKSGAMRRGIDAVTFKAFDLQGSRTGKQTMTGYHKRGFMASTVGNGFRGGVVGAIVASTVCLALALPTGGASLAALPVVAGAAFLGVGALNSTAGAVRWTAETARNAVTGVVNAVRGMFGKAPVGKGHGQQFGAPAAALGGAAMGRGFNGQGQGFGAQQEYNQQPQQNRSGGVVKTAAGVLLGGYALKKLASHLGSRKDFANRSVVKEKLVGENRQTFVDRVLKEYRADPKKPASLNDSFTFTAADLAKPEVTQALSDLAAIDRKSGRHNNAGHDARTAEIDYSNPDKIKVTAAQLSSKDTRDKLYQVADEAGVNAKDLKSAAETTDRTYAAQIKAAEKDLASLQKSYNKALNTPGGQEVATSLLAQVDQAGATLRDLTESRHNVAQQYAKHKNADLIPSTRKGKLSEVAAQGPLGGGSKENAQAETAPMQASATHVATATQTIDRPAPAPTSAAQGDPDKWKMDSAALDALAKRYEDKRNADAAQQEPVKPAEPSTAAPVVDAAPAAAQAAGRHRAADAVVSTPVSAKEPVIAKKPVIAIEPHVVNGWPSEVFTHTPEERAAIENAKAELAKPPAAPVVDAAPAAAQAAGRHRAADAVEPPSTSVADQARAAGAKAKGAAHANAGGSASPKPPATAAAPEAGRSASGRNP